MLMLQSEYFSTAIQKVPLYIYFAWFVVSLSLSFFKSLVDMTVDSAQLGGVDGIPKYDDIIQEIINTYLGLTTIDGHDAGCVLHITGLIITDQPKSG